jgi:ABC-type phosphate transport system permease subunit
MPHNRIPETVLILVGFSVIVTGLVLVFLHQSYEISFQNNLLQNLKTDYHWRPVGGSYNGLSIVVVGALMMTFGALIALRKHE